MSLASELSSAQKLYKSGDAAAALECCKRAMKHDGAAKTIALHLTFGAVFTALEEPELAEKAFDTALDMDADSIPAFKGKASLLEQYGSSRLDELLPLYKALMRLDISSKPGAAAAATAGGKPAKGGKSWAAKVADVEKRLGIATVDYSENYEDGSAKRSGGGKKGGNKSDSGEARTSVDISDGSGGAGDGGAAAKAAAAAKYEARMAKLAADKAKKEGKAGKGRAAATSSAAGEGDGEGEGEGGGEGGGGGGGGGDGEGGDGGGEASGTGGDGDGDDDLASKRAELADLRQKVEDGTQLSGKPSPNPNPRPSPQPGPNPNPGQGRL